MKFETIFVFFFFFAKRWGIQPLSIHFRWFSESQQHFGRLKRKCSRARFKTKDLIGHFIFLVYEKLFENCFLILLIFFFYSVVAMIDFMQIKFLCVRRKYIYCMLMKFDRNEIECKQLVSFLFVFFISLDTCNNMYNGNEELTELCSISMRTTEKLNWKIYTYVHI